MRFTLADQFAFSALSGDRNPLHLDAAIARSTLAGKPIAHGINVMLRVLDQYAADPAAHRDLSGLKIRFEKFVYLDTDVTWHVAAREVAATRLAIMVPEGRAASCTLRLAPSRVTPDPLDLAALAPVVLGEAPQTPTPAEMASLSGWLPAETMLPGVVASYPRLCAAIGEDRVAALAALSALVGMVCPGLPSLFASLDIELVTGAARPAGVGFSVMLANPVHHLVVMQVAAGRLQGKVTSYLREPAAPAVHSAARPFGARRPQGALVACD